MNHVDHLVQSSSPANQWQIEVSSWFSTALASEQSWAVEWATQPKFLDKGVAGWSYGQINDTAGEAQCGTQLMHIAISTGHRNFSVLGMSLIIGLGSIIIIVGLTIDSCVGSCRRYKALQYKKEQWDAENTLALHRAAYARLGLWPEEETEMQPSSALLSSTPSGEDFRGGIGWEQGR